MSAPTNFQVTDCNSFWKNPLFLLFPIENNNKKFKSFKSKENIHKKEVGSYHGLGYQSLISNPINLAKGARGKYCEFENLIMAVVSKTDMSKNTKLFQIC